MLESVKECAVGRIVFADGAGPVAIPVNYGLTENAVIFRTSDDAAILQQLDQTIAFQVDQIDHTDFSGWSVLIRGLGERLEFEELPTLIREMRGSTPRPWAKGVHNSWVMIKPTDISGRKLSSEYIGF